MARPQKQTIDYFPHYVGCGKTIFILQQTYGNDGYAVWFKVLELLGQKEGHFYDCNNSFDWQFLLAKTCVSEDKLNSILDTLANLNAIDNELWTASKVIWSDNFIKNIEDVYKRRKIPTPHKPSFCIPKPEQEVVIVDENPSGDDVSDNINRQSKVNKSKGNKKKVKESKTLFAECVTLTQTEYQKLCNEHGQVATDRMIVILDNYKGSSGRKYASDYKAILSWVVDRYKEEYRKNGQPHARNTSTDAVNDFFTRRETNEHSGLDTETTENGRDIETIDISVS